MTGLPRHCFLFSNLAAIEIERLKANLKARLDEEDHGFRLTEMLDWFPPKPDEWLLDVIGYLEIARNPLSSYVIKETPDCSDGNKAHRQAQEEGIQCCRKSTFTYE